jgi:hypothetical protein
MKLAFKAIGMSIALVIAMPASYAQVSEETVTLRGNVSNLDIVRGFLISQADDGFEELAGKHSGVDPGALAELQTRSKMLRDNVNRNGKELDLRLCNEGAALLNSKQEFDALYIEVFRDRDRADNAATARALDGLPDAAYKFLVEELANISFGISGSSVHRRPPNSERAVQFSCRRLSK